MPSRFQFRRANAAAWTSANPTLAAGELGYELDTNKFKIGNGTVSWNSLSYASGDENSILSTIVDAKGDLIVGTADNTVSRLAAGTNGYVLTADSSQTAGVKWAATAEVPYGKTQIVQATTSSSVSVSLNSDTTILVCRQGASPNFYGLSISNITINGNAPEDGRKLLVIAEHPGDAAYHNLFLGQAGTGKILGGPGNYIYIKPLNDFDTTYNGIFLVYTSSNGGWQTVGYESVDLSSYVTLNGTETLANKTLTTPTIGTAGFNIVGSTSGTTRITTAAVASGTVVVPAGAGTVATLAGTQTVTNKTINFGSNTITGTLAQFNTALTDQDFASLAGTETLSNKTLDTPNIGAATGTSLNLSSGTITAGALSGGLASNFTPSNVGTASAGSLSYPARADHVHGTTGLLTTSTASTGTGNLVYATSGTLVTPNLGTPSSITLNANNVAGTIANSVTSATNLNNPSTIVARDANGNFAAGTITALAGTVSGSLGIGGSLTVTSTVSGSGLAGGLIASATPLVSSGAGSVGSSVSAARQDHAHPAMSGTALVGGTLASGITVSSLTSFGTSPTLITPTIDNIKIGYTTIVTAAGTTVLNASSNHKQYFTGTSSQTVTMGTASTMALGQSYEIHNNSTGAITVNSSGGNLITTVGSNQTGFFTCILTSGTTAASWDYDILGEDPITTAFLFGGM